MRNRDRTIEVGSDDFNAMFTPDGKLDFNARKGLNRNNDPLDAVKFKTDPRDGRVEFAEHRELRDMERRVHRSVTWDNDNDDQFNEDW